jgi:hypothetical protein
MNPCQQVGFRSRWAETPWRAVRARGGRRSSRQRERALRTDRHEAEQLARVRRHQEKLSDSTHRVLPHNVRARRTCSIGLGVSCATHPDPIVAYYHQARTHLALDKDAPDIRPIELLVTGKIVELPEVGGLHHRYVRQAA